MMHGTQGPCNNEALEGGRREKDDHFQKEFLSSNRRSKIITWVGGAKGEN